MEGGGFKKRTQDEIGLPYENKKKQAWLTRAKFEVKWVRNCLAWSRPCSKAKGLVWTKT